MAWYLVKHKDIFTFTFSYVTFGCGGRKWRCYSINEMRWSGENNFQKHQNFILANEVLLNSYKQDSFMLHCLGVSLWTSRNFISCTWIGLKVRPGSASS